jgi:hypothetical protein
MAALPVVLNVSHFYGEVLKVPLGIMGLIFIAAHLSRAETLTATGTGVGSCSRHSRA